MRVGSSVLNLWKDKILRYMFCMYNTMQFYMCTHSLPTYQQIYTYLNGNKSTERDNVINISGSCISASFVVIEFVEVNWKLFKLPKLNY